MHTLLAALVSVLLAAGVAAASDGAKAQSPQAQRMTECNAQAGDRKLAGDARRQFMSDCLKGHAIPQDETSKPKEASPPEKATGGEPKGQGAKMKACNEQATARNLRGDERRQYMSQCLKAEKKS